jgi:hypothetical protein
LFLYSQNERDEERVSRDDEGHDEKAVKKTRGYQMPETTKRAPLVYVWSRKRS